MQADAAKYLEQGLERIPSNTDLLREGAKQALTAGRLDEASNRVKQARALDAIDPELTLLEYRVKVAQGDAAGALDALQSSATSSPALAVRTELARARMAAGELDAAQSVIETLVQDGAPGSITNALEGELLLRRGRSKEAVEAFGRTVSGESVNPDALVRLAVAQAAAGDLPAAEKSARSAITMAPASVEATALLVQVLMQANRPSDANAAIQSLKRRLPRDPVTLQLEATVAQRSGNVAAARKLLATAYELQPSADLVLQRFGLERTAAPSGARDVLREGVMRFPKEARLAVLLSEELSRSGDPQGAMQALEAVQREPGALRPVILNNLAWMHFEQGRPEALGLAREASRLAPKQASILDTLGWILVKTGQTQEGLEILRRALASDPKNQDVALHLIEAERMAGNRDRAETLASEWRARNPQLVARVNAALGE
jgi:predicted Zn-dependent protease